MTLPRKAIQAGARAIVAAEYDEEFYPFETSSRTEQQLALKQAEACLTAALAAEGMVLVPVDPSERMKYAGHAALDQSEFTETAVGARVGFAAMREVYRAMLSAYGGEDE